MKMTLEEMERKAYIEGNKELADFIADLIDTEFCDDCFFSETFIFEDFQCN